METSLSIVLKDSLNSSILSDAQPESPSTEVKLAKAVQRVRVERRTAREPIDRHSHYG